MFCFINNSKSSNLFRKTSLLRSFLLLLIAVTPGYTQEVRLPATKNQFIVIAHRGHHRDVPENTLAAVKEAIKTGADYVEIDVRSTRDGALVLLHDDTVDRMTNGSGPVKALTLAEIKKLAVTDKTKSSSKKHGIPELREVLKACKGKINIYLDFKDGSVENTWKEIKEAGMEEQVIVYINQIPHYRQWRKVAPNVPLMTSVLKEVTTREQLSFYLSQVKIELLDNVADAGMVETARENGVAVWQDVQSPSEGPESWKLAMDKGVQGLQTDQPDALIRWLNANGLRNGKAGSSAVPAAGPAKYTKLLNVRYGNAEDPDNRFDAFIPHNHNEKTRVIVYFHGGSWVRGDKSEFPRQLIDEWVGKKGYIVVSMNYRLVKDGKNLFPAQIEDIAKGLEKISSGARKYKYNGDEFALIGGSAGAHLALLYAYGYDRKKQVKTVINLWGAADLSDKSVREDGTEANNTVIRFLGEADPKAQICLDASPSYHLTKDTGVPTISFHGVKDPLIHVSQAENLHRKLVSLGIPSQLELYPDEVHGMSPAAAIDVFGKISAWLEKYYPAQ